MTDSNVSILSKQERQELMHDVDPGDAPPTGPAVFNNGDSWLNQHNREAWELARRSINLIKQSYKHEIRQCVKNKDYDKLVELMNEINDLIIYDPHAWGRYLPTKFFKWVAQLNKQQPQ